MKKSVFLIAVISEIKRIKRLATKKEIHKLDFKSFEHWSSSNCIYGQMTGYCDSKRARVIMPKKFDNIEGEACMLTSDHKRKFEDQTFEKGTTFTALEKYLYMCSKKTHKHIFDFLKGETENLVIK